MSRPLLDAIKHYTERQGSTSPWFTAIEDVVIMVLSPYVSGRGGGGADGGAVGEIGRWRNDDGVARGKTLGHQA